MVAVRQNAIIYCKHIKKKTNLIILISTFKSYRVYTMKTTQVRNLIEQILKPI